MYTKDKFLLILIAPSGGGKSTICHEILRNREDFVYSVSYTTRKARGQEEHGKDYFFLEREEFKKIIAQDGFLEYAEVFTNYYGTSRSFVKEQLEKGKHVLLDIDVQGALKILESGMRAVTVFLLPPSNEILEQRLKNRGTDSAEQLSLRLAGARNEIRQINKFDYLVINDSIYETVRKILSVIDAEENKIFRYVNVEKDFYGE